MVLWSQARGRSPIPGTLTSSSIVSTDISDNSDFKHSSYANQATFSTPCGSKLLFLDLYSQDIPDASLAFAISC